ncbi:unnamed protein product [Mycena citricolor]|uniref:Aldehyde dehydrogenase domain-containing protein n=1 Tax=Mycena citricolor TaxID=2018698 RepID=A0AAD2HR07_9AGAR|nr:unnamed protein product [Mycena citricolor]
MGLISFLLNPFISMSPAWSDDDDVGGGFDIVYPLTACIALGIWLVVERYRKAQSAPVVFEWAPPPAAEPTFTSYNIPNAHIESHREDENVRPGISVSGAKYITCFDPSTGMHLDTIKADSEDEIRHKIELAQKAQKSWRETTYGRRRRVLRSLNKWLVENQEICARVACRDTGKTLVDAALGEIITTCSKISWLIEHGEDALRPESRAANFLLFYKRSEVHYDPLGVVAGIVSWNYPLHNAWSPIIASIFAGNAVVLKCSENVLWSSQWFVGAIRKCLSVCGYEQDLVQLVCCLPEQADALTRSPIIRHITFIGSETVGRKIAMAATEHLTPVTLELGGKDPAVILEGTDLNKWASLWMRGIFQNSGQNCIGIERLIVHSSQYDDLHNLLEARAGKLRPGSVLSPSDAGFIPTVDSGAMISRERFRSLEMVIEEAREGGAHVLGGGEYHHPVNVHGFYFQATVVGPVTPDMRIANEELFAPVATLIPYDTLDEAVDIANGTRYALGASVFGPSQDVCMEVAKRLECGMVSVNDFGVFYLNQDLPFGGVKSSGYGRFGGKEGLRALTNPKAIMIDYMPSVVQTQIPRVLDYPLRSLVTSWEFVSGLITFVYGDGWRRRLAGLGRLVRASRA